MPGLVPGIHVFCAASEKVVDGRDKPGHDEVQTRMPSSFLTIPPSLTRFRLANASVPVCLVADAAQLKSDADGLASCDIVIDNARIAAIGPAAPANDGLPRFDLDRGIVLPRLIDVHTHIDKGQIWQRAQNPDGTHMGARTAVMDDRLEGFNDIYFEGGDHRTLVHMTGAEFHRLMADVPHALVSDRGQTSRGSISGA